MNLVLYTNEELQAEVLNKVQSPDCYLVGIYNQEIDVIEAVKEAEPDFLLLYHDDYVGVLRLARQVYRLYPKVKMIAFVKENDEKTLYQFMHHGIQYVFPIQMDSAALHKTLQEINQTEKERMKLLAKDEQQNYASKIISIYSGSGGSGKSVFASNLSIYYAKKGYKVALLDFDFAFGQLELLFDLKAKQSIVDLLEGFDELDSDKLKKAFYVHPSGVEILASPRKLEYSFAIQAKHLERILTLSRQMYDYVILDLSSEFSERNMVSLDMSNYVYLLFRQDLDSLYVNKELYQFLKNIKGQERMIPVLQMNEVSRLSQKAMEQTLQDDFKFVIPYDSKNAVESVNLGQPLLDFLPKSPYSQAFKKHFEKDKSKKGLFSLFKKGDRK